MKKISGALIIILSIFLITSGCKGKGTVKQDVQAETDTVSVSDTGYTGIKQYMSGSLLVKEITFKNGIRQGLMKSFYHDGKLRQTFWYENDLREDSAKWYYQEGQVFRSTPYKRDTIDGTQKQYFRNGKLRAMLIYKKGLRTPFLEEYTQEGKLVTGYPQMVVKTQDDYQSKGVYRISLALSDKSEKVRFYRGDFAGGVFDTVRCKKINTIKGVGTITLKKTGSPKSDNIGVIAEILTNYGNNLLIHKKIDLPYKDLN